MEVMNYPGSTSCHKQSPFAHVTMTPICEIARRASPLTTEKSINHQSKIGVVTN